MVHFSILFGGTYFSCRKVKKINELICLDTENFNFPKKGWKYRIPLSYENRNLRTTESSCWAWLGWYRLQILLGLSLLVESQPGPSPFASKCFLSVKMYDHVQPIYKYDHCQPWFFLDVLFLKRFDILMVQLIGMTLFKYFNFLGTFYFPWFQISMASVPHLKGYFRNFQNC